MKTFLWTTLLWIVIVIAWLLCLGFGNLGTQVLDNEWLISVMPKNLQNKVCEPVLSSALESMDWCAAAEANNCTIQSVETTNSDGIYSNEDIIQWLGNVMENQEIIYTYLQESLENINQSINNLQSNYIQEESEPIIDEKEQQRLQLQAQIEALQNEMASL